MSTLHLDALMRRLNYTFNQPMHLVQALTHRSAAKKNNERLEFLGDALLNSIISIALFQQFPEQSEGQLTRLRAHLVKEETLATIATDIRVGEALLLGQGELKTGGFRRASILADALEAILAAVFIDGGLHPCEQLILRLYHSRLNTDLAALNHKDPKTQLQEYLQARKQPLPDYELISVDENHNPAIFQVSCSLKTLNSHAVGRGDTRRKAEQEAAQTLLSALTSSKS